MGIASFVTMALVGLSVIAPPGGNAPVVDLAIANVNCNGFFGSCTTTFSKTGSPACNFVVYLTCDGVSSVKLTALPCSSSGRVTGPCKGGYKPIYTPAAGLTWDQVSSCTHITVGAAPC